MKQDSGTFVTEVLKMGNNQSTKVVSIKNPNHPHYKFNFEDRPSVDRPEIKKSKTNWKAGKNIDFDK